MSFANLLNKYSKQKRESPIPLDLPNEKIVTKKIKIDKNDLPPNLPIIHDSNNEQILFSCFEGSVTHYYHFLFGALFPLIEYHLRSKKNNFIILTDIGPMKCILTEMPFNIVEIRGPHLSDNNKKANDDKSAYFGMKLNGLEKTLTGYDCFNDIFYQDDYVSKMSTPTRKLILDYFKMNLPKYIKLIPTADIILIERATESYYSNVSSNLKSIFQTSGSQRRYISNHSFIASSLKNIYGDQFINLTLERSSLFYQYHMFSNAKIIIGQHGASLSNVFFMPKGSNVIEICPPWSRNLFHFKNLSLFCGVKYTSLHQDDDHSEIDTDLLLSQIESISSTWKK
jgi:hypothetical protein